MDERDWPHDPDGDAGSEGMRTYGMAILAKKLGDHEFPLSAESFVAAHGDEPVRINHRRVVSVGEIFEHVDAEAFEDVLAFHRAVGDAMRSGGFWDYRPAGTDSGPNRA